ncbi:MAG: hypothetical protein ACFFCQ_00545 [Promethearchaeota archaeon]
MTEEKTVDSRELVICSCDKANVVSTWHSGNVLELKFDDRCYGCQTRKFLLSKIHVEDARFVKR